MTERFFQIRSVNGLDGDPAVFVSMKNSAEAFLFDLGVLDNLSQKELLRVRHAFVSHAHMDHFMGFDRWLRVNIPHRRLLQIYGPAPFFERVQAKLKAYTWNLIDPDQVRFRVHEIQKDGRVFSALLGNSDDFAIRREESEGSIDRLVEWPGGAIVSGAILDHRGIPSIAYKFRAPDRLKVRTEQFEAEGLKPGPWVGELQLAVSQGIGSKTISIEGRDYTVSELEQKVLRREEGSSLVYCTDAGYNRGNVDALKKAFGYATDMICESSFLDTDRARAVAKAHLTSRQAALLAAGLSVQEFQVFHISGIYGTQQEIVQAEALAFFAEYQPASSEKLSSDEDAEILRCTEIQQ